MSRTNAGARVKAADGPDLHYINGAGHPDVHEHQVWLELAAELEGLPAVLSLAHDL